MTKILLLLRRDAREKGMSLRREKYLMFVVHPVKSLRGNGLSVPGDNSRTSNWYRQHYVSGLPKKTFRAHHVRRDIDNKLSHRTDLRRRQCYRLSHHPTYDFFSYRWPSSTQADVFHRQGS